MELASRRDQFSFFLGFVARTKKRQLAEAMLRISNDHPEYFIPSAVFDICPFNDSQEQIHRAYAIYEHGKITGLTLKIKRLLEEFFFLVSDFEPPCCGDGRTFYAQTSEGQIVLVCDRCETVYSLDERPISKTDYRKMTKADFLMLFESETAGDWPFHKKVHELTLPRPPLPSIA